MHRNSCIICSSGNVHKVLDLGRMPNANELVKKHYLPHVKSYPLRFYWCKDCGFLQQLDIVDRKKLFENNYTYQTGVNEPAVKHFAELSGKLSGIRARGFGLIIASNDGTEIKLLKDFGGFTKVIGVEPARNIAAIANRRGLRTINDFFTEKLSKRILDRYGKADVIVANNVMAHVPEPLDMLSGIRNLLGNDGYSVVEVQWLRDVVRKLEVETLYAEHYYVWTVKAMEIAASKSGLRLVDVEYLSDIHGGSVRFWLRPDSAELEAAEKRKVKRMKEMESKAGLYSLNTMKKLQNRANDRKKRILKLVNSILNQGKTIEIWTVPAKVPTILNFCGLDSSHINCAYDAAKTKNGKYIPKANIQVKNSKLLNEKMKNRPDYIIVGAWNYMDLARQKFSWFTRGGGKLITLLDVKVVKD